MSQLKRIARLRGKILDHLAGGAANTPLGGVGIFHTRMPQSLHNVPIQQPLMVMITGGTKLVAIGERRITIRPGELLLSPGDCELEIGNLPGGNGEPFLSLAIGFSAESIEQFRRYPRNGATPETTPVWSAPAPQALVAVLEQWVDWCLNESYDPLLAQHRQVEMLLLLERAGLAGNLLLDREASWRSRVAQLIALNPAEEWNAGAVCRRLAIGESTLRRRLQEEGSSFREIIEETRLVAGLALLQETFWPVGQVAEAVGYRSHSRFSERFKERFGMSPMELKKTRASENGEFSSV